MKTISKSKMKIIGYVVVCLAAFFNSQLFLRLPYEGLLWKLQALYLLGLVFFGYLFLLFVLVERKNPAQILTYQVFVYLAVFCSSAMVAVYQHDQPVIYGLLASRSFVAILSALLIFLFLRQGVLSVKDVANCLLGMAWFSLILFFGLTFVIDASSHVDETSNVGKSVHLGVRYMFNVAYIIYGCIYYNLRLNNKFKSFDVIAFCSFFGYILFIFKGRATILLLLAIFFVILLGNIRRGRKTAVNMALFVSGVVAIFFTWVLSGEGFAFFDHYVESFQSALAAVGGELGDDPSANSRVFQVRTIVGYWEKGLDNWLLGTGYLSHSWHQGYKGQFGYLYPSDTGMFGGTFVFGAVGTALLCSTVVQLMYWANKAVATGGDHDIRTMRYYVIYYVVMSLSTFEIFLRSYQLIVLCAVFGYLAYESRQNSAAGGMPHT